MIAFRHADPRFPFLWETADQPPARWHDAGEGPVQYLADTPDGAWSEFIRHEEIRDPEELEGVERALWAVELVREPDGIPEVPDEILFGDADTYPACRAEARRIRSDGHAGLVAPSASLLPGGAGGWTVEGGLRCGAARDGRVIVLFGMRPDLVGWVATIDGRPDREILERVRHFGSS